MSGRCYVQIFYFALTTFSENSVGASTQAVENRHPRSQSARTVIDKKRTPALIVGLQHTQRASEEKKARLRCVVAISCELQYEIQETATKR